MYGHKAEAGANWVTSVIDKTLRLIDLVAAGRDRLSDLVAEAGLSRSTTHRLLATLVEHGYLSHSARRYELGYRLLELGEKKKKSLGFLETIRPVLHQYSAATRDTIHVAVLSDRDIVLIDRIIGQRELQIRSFIGQRTPAYSTAVGKALISKLPPRQWSAYLQQIPPNYPKTPAQIRADLDGAQKHGFAYDIDECSVGTCGVAATFQVSEGFTAAVSINGATVYFQNDRIFELSSTVKDLARQVEAVIKSPEQGNFMPHLLGAAG